MARWIKFVVVILLLTSVLYVFISPAVDLEPTVLRALKFACLIFAALLAAIFVRDVSLCVPLALEILADAPDSICAPSPGLIDLNCTRLC